MTERLQALLFAQNTLLAALADTVFKADGIDRRDVRRLLEARAGQTRRAVTDEKALELFDVATARIIGEYAPPDDSGPEPSGDPPPHRPDWFRGIVVNED